MAVAGFTGMDFTVAGSTVDGTAASRACTMVSATGTGATASTAGATGVTAGGGVAEWDGIIIQTHMATIQITATTTTANLTPPSIGTTAPIPQAITRT
jgi:hypothetical protein